MILGVDKTKNDQANTPLRLIQLPLSMLLLSMLFLLVMLPTEHARFADFA